MLYYVGEFPKLSESFIINEVVELINRGHNVTVLSIRDPDNDITHTEYEQNEIDVHYLNILRTWNGRQFISTAISQLSSLLQPTLLKYPFYACANIYLTSASINTIMNLGTEFDIIHTHFASPSRIAAIRTASYFNIPCTITTHAYDLYRPPNPQLLELILDKVDKIFTISEYNKQYMEREIGVSTEMKVVHAGIRPEKFETTENTEPHRLLTVSRLTEKKGLGYAIDAISKVAESYPEVDYRIVGSGEDEAKIQQQIDRCGLRDNVTLLGNISDEELISELDRAQAFLLPCIIAQNGDRDGIPVALMEAMSMETPPISTAISGIPELITNNQDGLLVKPRDSEGMRDAIFDVFQNPTHASEMGKRARQKIESEFNIAKECEKICVEFEHIIAMNKS